MVFRSAVSKLMRRTAYGLGGTTIIGCSAVTAYTFTDQGLGLRREIRFWGKVAPVVFDYWWHISSSSPLVKFQRYFYDNDLTQEDGIGIQTAEVDENSILSHISPVEGDGEQVGISPNENEKDHDDDGYEYKSEAQKAIYKKLHTRNAPKIFSIMLELGGLYIKLGQVLSVTALPVPSDYRKLFRTLQSSVPGHEEFEEVIKPTLEAEFGMPIEEVFQSIDEIPCGAASIGQAHKAKLLHKSKGMIDERNGFSTSIGNGLVTSEGNNGEANNLDVIVKVQYPDAKWQVPADVQCVGDFLQLCVYFGVVDESSAKLSYDEFSRQFLAELDYLREARNLQEVYESSLDPDAPYIKRGVEIPRVFPELCSNQVITMTYLPGPKFEEEARKQLESLGINTSRGVHSVLKEDRSKENDQNLYDDGSATSRKSETSSRTWFQSLSSSSKQAGNSWIMRVVERMGTIVGVDNMLFLVRLARQTLLWTTAAAVQSIQLASRTAPSILPISRKWLEWAENHEYAASQADMLDWTSDAIDALFDVHGYQIFQQGLFNADAHPGNILIIQNDKEKSDSKEYGRWKKKRPKLGLIDYGQCKRLNIEERKKVAKLIVSVANDESDEQIALHCRNLGFLTKNDSTKFLSSFARLMFGKFRSEYLKRDWHKSLHDEDEIVYFPNELSMVYRASLLLRGLAMSFQLNISVGEKWLEHAQSILEQ
mmetsp:Transcript_11672/g.27075  ORF Transcript_11672/g.27075 Transcript_11672/m.27075 type:complete len:708 (+) Transcript_11672:63-2186(+)